ncbi:MAG: EamA family transporter [Actinomycetota bacterium]
MHLLLAGIGAIVVGTGDFIGGTAARRDHPRSVAILGFIVGTLLLAAIVPFGGGSPTAADLGWSAVSGVGAAVGVFTLYRGFQRAPMGLVAPIAAVIGGAIPVVGGLAAGESVTTAAGFGLLAGAAAVVLVSRPARANAAAGGPDAESDAASDAEAARRAQLSGIGHGVATGIAFGVLLLALAYVGDDAGYVPVLVSRITSTTLLIAHALATGWSLFPVRAARPLAALAGVLTSLGGLLYFLAISVGPVLESAAVYALFPASTVVLAWAIHRERLSLAQIVGVTLALVATVLLSIG